MEASDHWSSLTAEKRQEILDTNQLSELEMDSFYKALEYAENVWTHSAICLIKAGAEVQEAINICALGCATAHQSLRAVKLFHSMKGLELNGSHAIISEQEAALSAMQKIVPQGMVYERRPPERSGFDQDATAGSLTLGLSVTRASVSRLI